MVFFVILIKEVKMIVIEKNQIKPDIIKRYEKSMKRRYGSTWFLDMTKEEKNKLEDMNMVLLDLRSVDGKTEDFI